MGIPHQLIKNKNKVLSQEYINWLSKFTQKVKAFDDEANFVHYSDNYTEAEKENIFLVSTLFSVLSAFYDKNCLEYDIKKANFHNIAVTVNLTDDTSVELRLWLGQGAVTTVSLIAAGSGKVDIQDVIVSFVK